MDNYLIELYQSRLKLENAKFSSIDHDDTMVAIVYKVELPDDKQYILKICTHSRHYYNEAYFLKHFADILPVPHIIKTVEPEAKIHGAILMQYLPGTVIKSNKITGNLAYQMGIILGQIHSHAAKSYGNITQPHTLDSSPIPFFKLKFEESFNECSNNLPITLLRQCLKYYNKNINLLTSVDGPRLVHGDFRPGNILSYNNELQGVIDWSSGRGGFTEEDFCSLEHEEWPINSVTRKLFKQGYNSIRPIPDYNNILSLLRLSKAIAIIGFTVKSGTWNNKNYTLYESNRRYIENFFNSSESSS